MVLATFFNIARLLLYVYYFLSQWVGNVLTRTALLLSAYRGGLSLAPHVVTTLTIVGYPTGEVKNFLTDGR